ncbi:MAG: ABC transporter ATP-binding protein [Lentisphaeria bacterium]
MKIFKVIWQLSEGGRLSYFLSIIFMSVAVFFSYTVPIATQVVIDSVIGEELPNNFIIAKLFESFGGRIFFQNHLAVIALIIFFIICGEALFSFLKGSFVARASENVISVLRRRVFHHLLNVPYSYHGMMETGNLIQRCTSDVETVRQFLANQLLEFIRVTIMVVGVIPILFMYNGNMAIAATILLPVILLYSGGYFFKMRRFHQKVAESEANMSSTLQENLTGVRVVKAFGRQEFESTKFNEKNTLLRESSFKLVEMMASYWATSAVFCMLQIGCVLIYGIYCAIEGNLQIGEFAAFMSYEVMLVWTIRGMGRILGEMGRATISFNRINEILSSPLEDKVVDGLETQIMGEIEFKNVFFSYDKQRPILKNINIKIKAGTTVAIVGPTGAGKSTLVNLLCRLYDVDSGEIKVDGHNLKEYQVDWLRKNIAILLQEPFLFSRTISENIAAGNLASSKEEILLASEIANITDAINNFSDSFDTVVGERGVTLSGGQKQRLAIARAIITPHPVIVFDDSLSAVDAETDYKIRMALDNQYNMGTKVIIAHRLSTIFKADKILVLENGSITGEGTHSELLSNHPLYKNLWETQQNEQLVKEYKNS